MNGNIDVKKTIKLNQGEQGFGQKLLALNELSGGVLNGFFSKLMAKANLTELKPVMAILSGDVKAGLGGLVEGLIRNEADRRLNDKDGKDDKDGKPSTEDAVKNVLNDLFGGGSKKKKEEAERKKAEELQKEKERKKKEAEKKKPIDKDGDLIKKLDDLFK